MPWFTGAVRWFTAPMCILVLALDAQEDFPVLLIFNRDEEFARRTTGLQCGADGVVCCTDEQAGGTWMAVGADGGIAALTNVRCLPPAHAAELQSRGALVRRVVAGDAAGRLGGVCKHNLLHGRLARRAEQLLLSTSGPADLGGGAWRTRTVAVPLTAADGRPRVYTKTNDASGELTAEESAGDAAWPKAAWLRGAAARALAGATGCTGRAGAEQLLAALEPLMSTGGALPDATAAAAAAVARGTHSHAPPENERRYQAAPFVQPFDLSGGFGDVRRAKVVRHRLAVGAPPLQERTLRLLRLSDDGAPAGRRRPRAVAVGARSRSARARRESPRFCEGTCITSVLDTEGARSLVQSARSPPAGLGVPRSEERAATARLLLLRLGRRPDRLILADLAHELRRAAHALSVSAAAAGARRRGARGGGGGAWRWGEGAAGAGGGGRAGRGEPRGGGGGAQGRRTS